MMNNARAWWRGKSRHKRENRLLVALFCTVLATGFVEAGAWLLVIAAMLPVGCIVYLECWE